MWQPDRNSVLGDGAEVTAVSATSLNRARRCAAGLCPHSLASDVVLSIARCGQRRKLLIFSRREHAAHNPQGVFDDAMSSFFRNVDARFEPPQEIPLGGRVRDLRARAVVIDMEEGVVNSLLQGPLG